MPGGRPTLYRPEYCDELVEHMRSGLSFESFAGKIGVCRETIYLWSREHEEFMHAKNIGAAASLHFWEEKGRNALYDDKFRQSLYIFTMKARFRWADQVVVIKNEKEEQEKERLNKLTDAELVELLNRKGKDA